MAMSFNPNTPMGYIPPSARTDGPTKQDLQQQQNQLDELKRQYQALLDAQTANQTGQYSPILEASVQNPDGSFTAPTYRSILDADTGLLQEPYILNNTLNTQGLDEYRNEALRAPGQASAWLTMAQNQNKANTMNQYSDLGAQLNAAQRSAYDNLASTGGLDSGARERIAQSSANDFMRQRQGIANQANLANLDLQKQDEQNRLTQLAALPGMELAKSQFDQQIQGQNIKDALAERNYTFQNAMDAWKTKMDAWGANKQADAQASASGGK